MKLQKGDQVLIIKGKDKGRKGKILRGFPKESKVLVEGINIKKKHQKPKKEGEKGQVVEIATPLFLSNVKLICPKCKKPTRIGYRIKNNKAKQRICKKCKEEL
jgi:large subunit ribosomal protein L24